MKRVISLALAVLLSSSVLFAQTTGASTSSSTTTPAKRRARRTRPAAAAATSPSVSAQIQELRNAIAQQQQQIQQLQQQLQQRDQAVQQAQQQLQQSESSASAAQTKADTAAAQSASAAETANSLKSDVSDLKQNAANAAITMQEDQKRIREATESPLAIHYKGITITPGGFLAAESVWRQHALAADINTPFNAIPFHGSSQSSLSEFFGSGRQSRVAMLAEGKLKEAKLSGYVEADFLSAGITSNNNQSNSYTMRQRQMWGQAAIHGWSFTGGQMWSLVTETKKGVDNRTEALPMTIDPQYAVGFSWARQYGFRIAKNLNDKAWLAFAVENAQTTLAAHGNASNFVLGSAGNGGGLYNSTANYSFNKAPDFVAKLAFEPGFGHYEIFALASEFRDRVFPNAPASAAGAFNDSKLGGGLGANARGSFAHKHIDIGVHVFGGNGVGRYGTGGLPDATVHPDGTLALLRSYQALGTLEFHHPKWDIYGNAGAEYASRNWRLNSAGKPVGYGSALFSNAGCGTETLPSAGNGFSPGALANCTGDTRNLIEGSFGFYYKPYTGDRGRIQFGPQYSYIVRNTWTGVGGQPHAIENMVLTSFRYYLP